MSPIKNERRPGPKRRTDPRTIGRRRSLRKAESEANAPEDVSDIIAEQERKRKRKRKRTHKHTSESESELACRCVRGRAIETHEREKTRERSCSRVVLAVTGDRDTRTWQEVGQY